MIKPQSRLARALSLGVAATVVGSFIAIVGGAAVASATPGPVAPVNATAGVSADALPTVQIDGVVWSQAIVGNTVYAGGSFANARPAGAAAGTNQVARTDLLSYNITTGVMNASFDPVLNGQVKVVTASPDGSRIYIGGDFTSVNGQPRYRIAAFNTSDGSLVSNFAPVPNTAVDAIVATNSTVYFGGAFTTVGSSSRPYLAAVSASNGALTGWAPAAAGPTSSVSVATMVMTPDGTEIIAGGNFQTVNGAAAYGLAAISVTDGSLQPWAAGSLIRDAGANSGITDLTTDGTAIYGTGYVFGAGGNLEGTFSASPNSGAINWVEDCHGDTYGNYASGGTVYVVSHEHFCGNVGGFPQTEPVWTNHRATAFTTAVTGTLNTNTTGSYYNYGGTPSPSMVNWFPDLTVGSYTGATQAAWDLTGNGEYVILGGEFPTVNGVGQQGLVRFQKRADSPNKQGAQVTGFYFTPTMTNVAPGTVHLSWPANWDRDDMTMTYKLVRDGKTSAPIYTTTVNSTFWNRPDLGFTDTGLVPGSTHTYRLFAVDPWGNSVGGNTVTDVISSTATSSYQNVVTADGAANYWRLGDTSTTAAADWAGYDDLALSGTVTRGAAGAISGDSDTATTFDGSTGFGVDGGTGPGAVAPNTFSIEAWVKTTSTTGGKIVGYGDLQVGLSQNYDRQIYMDNTGHLIFGVYNGTTYTVRTSGSYNNGAWHHVVGTLGSSGVTLYVDGQKIGTNAGTKIGQAYTGYWHVGGDNLKGWPNVPTSNFFKGSIDDVSIYPTQLTAAQVSAHYAAATGAANAAPTASFTSTTTNLTANFNGSASHDSDGTIAGYAWTFGDGGTATGATPSHTYTTAGTYTVTLTVTDNGGATNSTSQTVTVTPPPNVPPTASFTATTSNNTVSVNGSASSDSDGTVAGYAWTFGDGGTATGATATHAYTAAGTYTVTLTVTDNSGATNATSQTVTVTAPPNVAPTASFTISSSNLNASVDGSASSDSDGTIAGYAWTFGDGGTATGATASHSYTAAGTYTVTLTVTDNGGLTNSVSHAVTVTPANVAPTASFTASSSNLTTSVDGSASSDSDGTIAGYAWTFGDGGTATGATASHTYAAAGTYTVTLTVTDNSGATGTSSQSVTVTAPAGSALAADSFNRTATSKWGNADTGGAWTVQGAAGTNFNVTPGFGTMKLAAGASEGAYLNTLSLGDTDSTVSVAVDKPVTGSGNYLYLAARHSGTSEYRLRVKVLSTGVVQASLTKLVSGTETVLVTSTITGLTFTGGSTTLNLRLQVSGTSTVTLNGKVWAAGTTEPTGFQVTKTDASTPLTAGAPGVAAYLSGSATNAPITTSFSNFSVGSF